MNDRNASGFMAGTTARPHSKSDGVTNTPPVWVTIAIPTRNRLPLLKEAVRSALDQTFPSLEIVIGDDSDGEETVRWVESMNNPRIRWFRNHPPLGQAANTNACFDNARGEFLVLLHDDDLLAEDAVETLVGVFQDHPNTAIAFGMQTVLRDDGTPDPSESAELNRHYRRSPEFAGRQPHAMVSVVSGQIPSNGWMVRSETARSVRFRDWKTVGDACDFDFTHRVVLAGGDIHFVPRELASYRLTRTSVSRRKGFSIETTFEVIRDAKVPPEFEELRRQAEGERALIAAHGYADRGRFGDAWRAWRSDAIALRARCSPTAVRLLARLAMALLRGKGQPKSSR